MITEDIPWLRKQRAKDAALGDGPLSHAHWDREQVWAALRGRHWGCVMVEQLTQNPHHERMVRVWYVYDTVDWALIRRGTVFQAAAINALRFKEPQRRTLIPANVQERLLALGKRPTDPAVYRKVVPLDLQREPQLKVRRDLPAARRR